MNAKEVCDLVFGAGARGAGPSAYTKRLIGKSMCEASEAERRAIVENPDRARRYSWLLASAANIARLRTKGAYCVSAFSDDDVAKAKDNLDLRDWVARTFACQPTAGTGDADPRDYFIVWRVFHERNHMRYVYLPESSVERAARTAGITQSRFKACVAEGPPDSRVVTHIEFTKMQAAIRAFLRNACVLRDRALPPSALLGLDEHQRAVAAGIVGTPFSVLHGGAGTGKSTLIAAVVASFLSMKTPVLCLAPTHRAKKNLAKRLPSAANVSTIDSFIKSASNSQAAAASKSAPAAGGETFIFVDEASMVDLEKLATLARTRTAAQGHKWQVCMTGDDGQLEPIDRGEMFRTMIYNGGAHVFQLLKCYRAENEDLLEAQRCIRDGRMPSTPSDAVRIELVASDRDVERLLVPYIREHTRAVQYIAWTNKMCDFVNAHVQCQVHGRESPPRTDGGSAAPLVGDKVVYIGKNNVKKGLTNAMIGTVRGIDAMGLEVCWDDGGGIIACARSEVILAYCVTVHRAQGSQFEHVCVVATNVDAMMRALDRRWAYTAVSRAQRRCDIFSTKAFPEFIKRPVRRREMVGINFNSINKGQQKTSTQTTLRLQPLRPADSVPPAPPSSEPVLV